jgi:hypothetical protein
VDLRGHPPVRPKHPEILSAVGLFPGNREPGRAARVAHGGPIPENPRYFFTVGYVIPSCSKYVL